MRNNILVFLLLIVFTCSCATAQADTARLLVMGDSLTGGLYASDDAHMFARLLADDFGAELATCRGTYVHNLLDCELDGFDYIVIEIGLNDVSNWNNGSLPENEWIETYEELVQNAQMAGATVIVATMFHAVPTALPTYEKYERYNGHIQEIAATTGATFADVWGATKNCQGCISQHWQPSAFPPGYAGDNFHPNDVGHALIAQTIYKATQTRHLFFPVVPGGAPGYPVD